MPETPRGLTYPDSGDHTRLWEHFQTLAEDVEALYPDRPDGDPESIPWEWHTFNTWAFSNGSVDVNYGGTTPPGWEWADIPMPVFLPRSNAFPSYFFWSMVGNVAIDGCTIHCFRSDGTRADGSIAIAFSLTGRIKRTP